VRDANQFTVTALGSGSKGNATLIRINDTLLLVDNGFSCKEIESRLQQRGVSAEQITAILVTHEHSDHFKGVPTLSHKYQIPVHMNLGTSLHKNAAGLKHLHLFNSHQSFKIDGITVNPVSVPHDSREACQFVFECNQQKVGLLTDLGHITPYVTEQYQDCDILLLEFNHQRELLLAGPYPASLKSRVTGNYGHLCNVQASEFLTEAICHKLQYLVAMHLSEENNKTELVKESINNQKLNAQTQVILADQNQGFDWITVQ
jgi:phosphoribosyl 1,2-cyclic phosphodiesterase